jgi:hypothetical protein
MDDASRSSRCSMSLRAAGCVAAKAAASTSSAGRIVSVEGRASAGIESTSCRTGKEPLGAAASGTVVPRAATPPLLNARNVAEGAAPPSRQADDHVRGKRSPHGGVVARSLAVESAHRGGTLVQPPISVRTATLEGRRPRCVCSAHARIVGARGATRPALARRRGPDRSLWRLHFSPEAALARSHARSTVYLCRVGSAVSAPRPSLGSREPDPRRSECRQLDRELGDVGLIKAIVRRRRSDASYWADSAVWRGHR